MIHPPDPSKTTQPMSRVILTGLAILLVAAGQLWFYSGLAGLWPGVLFSLLGVGCLLWAGARQPAWAEKLAARVAPTPAVVGIGLAIGLAGLASLASLYWERVGRFNYMPILFVWLAGAILYVAALAGRLPSRSELLAWWRAHQTELIVVGLTTLLAAGLRFYQLGDIPRVIDGDEGRIGQYALTANHLPLANPFSLAENFGALYLQLIHAATKLFGQTPFALRLLPALAGTLAVPALYLLARELFGQRVAALAAALLAVAHAHIHFSRIVPVAYIQGTLFVPLELYFFWTGLQQRSRWRLGLGGVILGLHFNFYVGAQIIAGMLVAYLLIAAVACRPLVQHAGRRIAFFWIGTLLVALPMILFSVRHPDLFFERLNADGTFQSGWLMRAMAETGQSAPAILGGRILHAWLSVNFYPARDFYNIDVPLLGMATSAFYVLGLGFALWRTRNPRYLLLNGYFWGTTVAVGVFAVPESADSYRMLAALPAAIALAAIGVDELLKRWGLDAPAHRASRTAVLGALLGGVLLLNVRTYFFDFAGRCRYGLDQQTRFASYLGNHLRLLDRELTVYLLSDDTFRFGTHNSVDFLSDDYVITNLPGPITDQELHSNDVIIAGPSRMDELRTWAAEHSGGALILESDCDSPMLLAYRVP